MKFKQIVTTVSISAVTAVAAIFVYSKYFQSRQPVFFQNGTEVPVNYTRYMPGTEGNSNATPPSDFTSAAKTAVPGVVHIKTKINPRQISSGNNLQRKRSILQDLLEMNSLEMNSMVAETVAGTTSPARWLPVPVC